MLYCPNCHRLCHEDRCDECSRVLTRGPEPEDFCLLIELGALEGGMSEDAIFLKNTFNEASALMYELDAGREKVILLENDLPDNYK